MVYDSVVCTELSKMGNYENIIKMCGGAWEMALELFHLERRTLTSFK